MSNNSLHSSSESEDEEELKENEDKLEAELDELEDLVAEDSLKPQAVVTKVELDTVPSLDDLI